MQLNSVFLANQDVRLRKRLFPLPLSQLLLLGAMAGWQDHVVALCKTGYVNCAAIYGLNGLKWANMGFEAARPEEVKSILFAITNEQAAALMTSTGITFAGKHYIFLRRGKLIDLW